MLVQEEGLYRGKQQTASVTNTFRTAWAPSSRKSTPPRKPSPQKRAWQSIESAPHVGRRGLRRLLLHSCNRSDSPQRDGFPGCASAVELHCENPLRGGRECMLKTNYTRRASARNMGCTCLSALDPEAAAAPRSGLLRETSDGGVAPKLCLRFMLRVLPLVLDD